MGLAVRIIPTLLCRGRNLVKGQQFQPWRTVGLATQGVRINANRGVDELALIDVGATAEGRGPDLDLVRELTGVLYAPLAVGGGIRSLEHVRLLLQAGADKVVIGAAAYEDPLLVDRIAKTVGSQAVVVAVDVRGGRPHIRNGELEIPEDPVRWARLMEGAGAGEILLTSVDREGTMHGYDLELVGAVARAVDIPVVAHGGCSGYPDMLAAIQAGASAVAAGALFQFTGATPRGAAEYLQANGVEVRL